MLSVAHKLFPDVGVSITDAGNLPFRDASFEVIVLRHVLEHLPQWLMERALSEAMRVARNTVVVDFYVPPVANGTSKTHVVGENFLETCWAVNDVASPIAKSGWTIDAQLNLRNGGEHDVIWILAPDAHKETQNSRERPKVSVIMPTYRRSHTLYRTVKTVQRQSYCNWELIVIDNEGTAGYVFDDPRISVHVHTAIPSASYARNKGLLYATGELVC